MEYDKENKVIYTNKIINVLDKFTIDFLKILEKHTNYVLVSGYVSILLGRTRASEDIDLLVPEMNFENFNALFIDLDISGFECLNSSVSKEAFGFLDFHAIRFSRKGVPVPNMEFKKISLPIQQDAYDNRLKVVLKKLGSMNLFISPLELQIAYKLSIIAKGNFEEISSDKDFEDAKHIYDYFKTDLNMEKLNYYVRLLKAEGMWKWLQK